MSEFVVGDHVENRPIATVDGIVYRVEGDTVRFCDEYGIKYTMRGDGLRSRYRDFSREETREILRINAAAFLGETE